MPQPNTGRRAREQAAQYNGVFANVALELSDGTTIDIPPHPNLRMLDDERQADYEELLFEIETQYDRAPDTYFPEQHLESGVVLPSETRKGAILEPYRKEGQLIKPPHSVRVVQVALGMDIYNQLRAGGKSSADVWRIWNEQGLVIADRAERDSKSNGSASPMATIPR